MARGRKTPKGFIQQHVDDPYALKEEIKHDDHPNKGKISVYRRSGDNYLLKMLARGYINNAQFLAGSKYMAAHLICTGQSGQGMDYSKQRVDTSFNALSLSEKQVQAQDVIRNANRELQSFGCNKRNKTEAIIRVQKIAGEGQSVAEYCKGYLKRKGKSVISREILNIKHDLTVLAKFWSFQHVDDDHK